MILSGFKNQRFREEKVKYFAPRSVQGTPRVQPFFGTMLVNKKGTLEIHFMLWRYLKTKIKKYTVLTEAQKNLKPLCAC
jgi:hypothetical protein